jgi:hypothetical protein
MQHQSYELQILNLLLNNIQVKPLLRTFGVQHQILNMSIVPIENTSQYKAIFTVSKNSYESLQAKGSSSNDLLKRLNFYIGNIKVKNKVKFFDFQRLSDNSAIANIKFTEQPKVFNDENIKLDGGLSNYALNYKVIGINDGIKCWCSTENNTPPLPATTQLVNPDLYLFNAYNNGFNKLHTLEFLPIVNEIYKIGITFTPNTLMPIDISLINFNEGYIFEDNFFAVSSINFETQGKRILNINPLNTTQTFNKSANNNTQAFSNNTNMYNAAKRSIYNIALEAIFNDNNGVNSDINENFNNQTNVMASYYQAKLDSEIRSSLSVSPLTPILDAETNVQNNCYLANIIASSFIDRSSENNPLSIAFTIEVLEDITFSNKKYHSDAEGYKVDSVNVNGLYANN